METFNKVVEKHSNTRHILITHQKDTLKAKLSLYNYSEELEKQTEIKNFFFTDRKIYRPGQTIYFKGIILKNNKKSKRSAVVQYVKDTVVLYDVNGQKINSLVLTTNHFGSYSGAFVIPESGLTGRMEIGNEKDQAFFYVEEYKRPRFFIDFDTLKDDYALNQKIHVKGIAKAYAGNILDGAKIKYRVMRSVEYTNSWAYYPEGLPYSPDLQIKNGLTTTREDGTFELDFESLPDTRVSPKALPVFNYTVYTDITDINGETRSDSLIVRVSYSSLQILTDIPKESNLENFDSILVRTQNLNYAFVPSKVEMTVAPLKFPGKIYRKRLWGKPDQYVMTETEFRAAFPDDEYNNDSDYRSWKEDKTIYKNEFWTTKEGKIAIPKKLWKNSGWHVFTFKTHDARGKEIMIKEYIYISIPGENQLAQLPLIVQTSKDNFEPGQTAILTLSFGYKNIHLLEVNSFEKQVKSNQVLSAHKIIKQKIQESDRGGIAYSWLFVFNNRVYIINKEIDVSWSNRKLHLEWATHRDKLLPGEKEKWTITIKGDKKKKVSAELLVSMYDASLDAFIPHVWYWDKLSPEIFMYTNWDFPTFQAFQGRNIKRIEFGEFKEYNKAYNQLINYDNYVDNSSLYQPLFLSIIRSNKSARDYNYDTPDYIPINPNFNPPLIKNKKEIASQSEIQIRKNLQETAFFFPQLQTDAEGNVQFKFTMPEALTEWKMMAFAHTKDWKTGYLEGKVKTQKDLMVIPNLPRFLRQGDKIEISTKINNLSNHDLNGTARIEILDAQTMQPAHLSFGLTNESQQQFSVIKGQSTTAKWSLSIPESRYTPVIIRITAKAGNFSDGEENTLPVITNRMLVTETFPLPIRGNGTKNFTFEKLKNQNSNTLVNRSLTVEFTGNPAWYAVQALPYLSEYPYECSEQIFNRFYANALAAHIVAQSPKIEKIFDQWRTKNTAALLSNLEKNQELKTALLEETPWVLEAKNETEQKHKIAKLFETHQIAKGLKRNLASLEQKQLPDGSFPWFVGMRSDRFITQYIITGIGKLQHLGVKNADYKKAENITSRALPYLDAQLKNDYDNLIKYKADLSKQQIGYTQIQYLYMRSFFKDKAIPAASKKAYDYYQKQAAQYWNSFNPYMKGMIALALYRANDQKIPNQIIASLKETAIENDEMGMYWKLPNRSYWWYQAPIEEQSLLIETFAEITKDEKIVDDLKTWLLKQKQTQNWRTTKATADAVYALLLQGSDWLSNTPEVTIQLGNKTIKSTEVKREAGTGYFKERILGKDVKPEMGNISVNIQNPTAKNPVSWGAVNWQYFEQMDKITSAETPLILKKQLFIERNSDKGPILTEIKEGNELKVGDKVKIRIVLKVDRDMEYVHMKDMRAAGFEPVNVLSGYRYQDGLGYYESTKDLSTNFFFGNLRKGTYVFEYPVFVNQKGDFSNGITTIQCMYAPEFSSHSEGIRVKVK